MPEVGKACDTPGDFICQSAKIARCARCSDCNFHRLPRSAYKIADVWHVRYRRLNSPAFDKCARPRDFLRSSLRIASKVDYSSWAIVSHDFLKRSSMEPGNKVDVPLRRDRQKKKKLTGMSASIGGENRL